MPRKDPSLPKPDKPDKPDKGGGKGRKDEGGEIGGDSLNDTPRIGALENQAGTRQRGKIFGNTLGLN